MAKKAKDTRTNEGANGTANKSRRSRSTTARKKASSAVVSAERKPKASKVSGLTSNPTDDEIRLRAYFIAERRHRLDLPGDADSDWLEAKRQLLSELGSR